MYKIGIIPIKSRSCFHFNVTVCDLKRESNFDRGSFIKYTYFQVIFVFKEVIPIIIG